LYAEYGRVTAREILLQPSLALAFVDDLERLGVEIDGVDFWRCQGDYVVEIPYSGDTAGNSLAAKATDASNMILDRRPSDAVYASVVFSEYQAVANFSEQTAFRSDDPDRA
jgi:hypothetical protein